MHLFAAQPGGFSDDEGIVDLDQQPARLVILSAADSTLSLLADTAEALPADYPSLRLANWLNLVKPAAFDLYVDKVLDAHSAEAPNGTEVVVLSLLGGESYWRYGLEQLIEWSNRPGRRLIVVPGEDYEDKSLLEAGNAGAQCAYRVWRYLREGGRVNAQALYDFLRAELLEPGACRWREPRVLPRALLYHPRRGEATLEEWQAEWRSRDVAGRPSVLLVLYRSHLQAADTEMFDALLEVLDRAGLNTLPLAVASLKEAGCLETLNHLLERSESALILNATGFAIGSKLNDGSAAEPSEYHCPFSRRVPVLQLVLASTTREEWARQARGLRARDLAMQVTLPELDGRIITRAVAFKGLALRHERSQIDSVRFILDPERANFVARLAAAWIRLARLDNAEKRIALVLANYPSSDARIGNGVGLDTPASLINLLRWLEQAGYAVEGAPGDGDALLEDLRATVTNQLDGLAYRPSSESLPLEQYQYHFERLPQECQSAVLERWGAPFEDPRFRAEGASGRFTISGRRFGAVFVGVQPARGFDIDQQALYHDPDLVPPHGYLAFYFWLRERFQADAVVHVGKHGNLEWLPGKGGALSNACWPEIALGPLPHVYPFIVNDPGEGAQAKRRAQAVIIDHLMPPMARAETYGELAELEELADEYYQALGVDPRRETRLKTLIAAKVRETHLTEELGLNAEGDDQTLLEELDAYLCEIKEASIRNGLHVLGELPARAELVETLVALLRLPRGGQAAECGLLHALARDLGLPEEYDPLSPAKGRWHGPRPAALSAAVASPWITTGDTRERLEALARGWVDTLLETGGEDAREALAALPATRAVLDFAGASLLPALERSATNERVALLEALAGRFVDPGPSGAPTRGRLDVLPTGRNFYAVDSRAIPSKTAWALGQQAADALIERYLQEHGDYPRSLGLSVWGTATMRTGGDDIAQAMALIGIEPVWAAGSQRLIDFRIIPAFQLGRPRVDVTLRVSGLFRDAFPNVIALFDAAVRKLAEYQEPGDGNSIRAAVENRAAELERRGESPPTAWRRASYRIFGAMPGAYGAGIQGLLDSGSWERERDLGGAYVQWGGYAYGQSLDGASDASADFDAFETRLAGLDAILHNQDNREHDLLDSGDYAQFQGGMAAAANALQGRRPALYFGDHADPARPRVRALKEELNRVVRARLLNPKWQAAMRRHGYKGAFEMAASVDYLFGFDATTGIVDDYQYDLIQDSLLEEPLNRDFFANHNPQAGREIGERLLEAAQRGMWQAEPSRRERLEAMLLEIDDSEERMD